MQYLHGLHDVDGAALMADRPGWLVITEAVGCDPNDHGGADYSAWTSRGYSVIVRLNNGYAPAGTIPAPEKYADFAQRCGNFVRASTGVNHCVIGNEPNHSNEWPNGQKIDPAGYAHCYAACRQAIHTAKPDCKVLVAGCAPWDNEAGMDWLDYWKIVVNSVFAPAGADPDVYPCDGFAIHAYTHGADPGLIHSDEKVNNWYWHFRTYRDQLAALPAAARSWPVYITETDQGDDAWADANSGWVQNAYAEIDAWNKSNTPTIHALCLYCTHKRDRWYIMDKAGVQADFRAAVAKGYQSPMPTPDSQPPTPPATPPPYPVVWDPRLTERGVKIERVLPGAPGTRAWRVTKGVWLDEKQSQGRHHFYADVMADGDIVIGAILSARWPGDGYATFPMEVKPPPEPGANFPMSKSRNEYSFQVNEPKYPSDVVTGVGMGAATPDGGYNSGIHTSTYIEWTLDRVPTTPPVVTHLPAIKNEPPKTAYVAVKDGANIRSGYTVASEKLGAVPYGEQVVVHGTTVDTSWSNVTYGDLTGWTLSSLLSSTPPVTAPTPEPGPSGDNFERALAFVRRWEGGWADNPADPGGATNKGITIGTYTRWREAKGLPAPSKDDLRNIPDAEVDEIYREWYWKASGADRLPWPLCLAQFDTAVNAGVGRAQEMLSKSGGDFLAYVGSLLTWYASIDGFETFGRAWTRRRADLLLEASKP